MQTAKNLREYRKSVKTALDNDFQRGALDRFAVAYRTGRENAFAGMDTRALIEEVARLKDAAVADMDRLYAQFKEKAEARGIHVHLAQTADAANAVIARIAEENGVRRVIKSKSMTAEETLLNHHLEAKGYQVVETDLGEWIIQLRGEGPSHMVMPAIHLSRHQVADLFSDVTGKPQNSDIERLVKVARRELRPAYVEADMGISGANVAIADTGTIGLTTNEGNARLVTTLPRVHVALIGLDKLVPHLRDALSIIRVLPRNATGQQLTSYVTWITGPNACGAAEDNRKHMHIVFLDNGRRALAKDPVFAQVLRCIRCGACANVCPVYRMVGGHQYGHIYIGAIGLINTYFFHGREKARHLVQNCINCGACKEICASGIDLPRLIKEVHAVIQDEDGHPVKSLMLARVMKNRRLFHRLLHSARVVQKPVTGGTPYLRHLPMIFSPEHNFRALPAIADQSFRDRWPAIRPSVPNPARRIALFSGCVQDFVYPEQLTAAVDLMGKTGTDIRFPMDQSCCGLPLEMMGEKQAAVSVARQNVMALAAENPDYVVTLCASCASHLKHAYPRLLENDPYVDARTVARVIDRVVPFSVFLVDVLDIDASLVTAGCGGDVSFHAPCHLCRGMGVRHAPHELIRRTGLAFVRAGEEETCCGFGGTYSSKFPAISREILDRKLDDFQATGVRTVVTECPGCVMQLRGGAIRRRAPFRVMHISEILGKPGPSGGT